MHCDEPDPGKFLPLHPLSFRVLMSVAERPSYGTEIVRTIEDAEEDTTLYPANLYRRIRDLLEDGLLRECEGPEGADPRRTYVAMTPQGRRVARAEMQRLRTLLGDAARVDLLSDA